MSEIPQEAMPVVELLRRDVPDPGLPIDGLWDGCRCPMGMHPKCIDERAPAPTSHRASEIIGVTAESARAFIYWWDLQNDHIAAYRLIWPEAVNTRTKEASSV